MHRTIPTKRMLLATAVAAAGVTGPLAQAASAGPDGPQVPSGIAVGAGHKVFLVGHATGVQIYTCNGSAWSLLAPRADLFGGKGQLIVTHFGGPTWQARDGSSVTAKRVNGVTVDPTAIAWLLLKADPPVAGADGDRLARTTFIQRTATTGGLAPAPSTCTASTAGTTVEVPYTADYHFWKATGA